MSFRKARRHSEPNFTDKKVRVFDQRDLVPGDHVMLNRKQRVDDYTEQNLHAIFIQAVDRDEVVCLEIICYVTANDAISRMFGPDAKIIYNGIPGLCYLGVPAAFTSNIKVFKYLHKHIDRNDILRRARTELYYNSDILPTDNESFVSYCLSGVRGVIVFVNSKDAALVKKLVAISGTQALGQAVETGVKVGIVFAASSIAKHTTNAALEATAKGAGKLAGPVLGSAVEMATSGFNIASKKRQLNRGELTRSAYGTSVAKEVTKTSGAILGGIGGSIIGEVVIPVPVLGGIVGGVLGGMIGGLFGAGTGSAITKLTEKIRCDIHTRSLSKGSKFHSVCPEPVYAVFNDQKSVRVVNNTEELKSLQDMINRHEIDLYETTVA